MVKIRLARGGAKKKPFYSIVATDSRKRRDSGYIERLGYLIQLLVDKKLGLPSKKIE
ncbi:SSU ribosomal protein S16p [uncultured Gammaproteobacteria bacterium]|nr:SSU ribosomal protein S16p [uncultured Gammaproteobacteria bacterium]